jgi:hypothetical protein
VLVGEIVINIYAHQHQIPVYILFFDYSWIARKLPEHFRSACHKYCGQISLLFGDLEFPDQAGDSYVCTI